MINTARNVTIYPMIFPFFLSMAMLLRTAYTFKPTHWYLKRPRQSIILNSNRFPGREQPTERSLRDLESRRLTNSALFPILAITSTIIQPLSANARKGAFEIDAEFYIRDLIRGNKAESNSTKRKPVFGSPRTLDSAFATETIQAVHQQISQISGAPVKDVTSKVAETVPAYLPNFTDFVPIKNKDLSDQYFFDITLYVSYLLAAELIPDPVQRIPLRKGIGSDVLKLLQKRKLVSNGSSSSSSSSGGKGGAGESAAVAAAEKMGELSKGVSEILKAFITTGVLGACEFDEEDLSDFTFAKASFSDGLPVSFQITLKNPATILGFLEQTAANSFFHPEIIATTIANYARTLGFRAHYEDYLMDNFYLYDQEENEVTAQDVILEMEVALQSSQLPDF